jgi:hypothetical protein
MAAAQLNGLWRGTSTATPAFALKGGMPWGVPPRVHPTPSVIVGPFQAAEVQFEGRVFPLREPIRVNVEYRNRLWVHECESLGISAFGPTRRESEVSFCMDFAALWDEIAQEDDGNLTPKALELKQQFLKLVVATEQVL